MKSRRSKATDIPDRVKKHVFERDNGACIWCENTVNVMPNAHIISRSKGGLGVKENIVTACTLLTDNQCHHRYDNGSAIERAAMYEKALDYLKVFYPDWDAEKYVYKKYKHCEDGNER